MIVKGNLGVCTWTFGDLPLQDIARRVKALGLDGVELMGDLSRYRASEAARILSDEGLAVFSLTPGDVDLAHPAPSVRAEGVDYFLRLLDFAAALPVTPDEPADHPLVACHGLVGRVRALSTQEEERALFVAAVRQIAQAAQGLGLRVVMEVLNRYEAHLNRTAAETVQFLSDLDCANVGILLDAYHMNIEEPDPASAIRQAGHRLWLYHVADSNREGIGHGHTDFAAQMAALADVGYQGPIILECTAPGPDPFSAIKDADSLIWLETYVDESRRWLAQAGR